MLNQVSATAPQYIGYEIAEFPARPAIFVNRVYEISETLRYLDHLAKTSGVLIYGQGGIGKTTMAIEASYRAWERRDYNELVFFSAKPSEYRIPEQDKVKLDRRETIYRFATYEGFLEKLRRVLLLPTFPREMKNDLELKAQHLYKGMTGKRLLFLIDNLDSIQNPSKDQSNNQNPSKDRFEKFRDFIDFLPPGNKVIVTTRDRGDLGDGGLKVLKLDPLTIQDSHSLIRELIGNLNLSSYQLREMLDKINGNPLHIRLLASILKGNQSFSVSQILHEATPRTLLSFLFQTTISQLSTAARKVLYVIVLATFPVTVNFISAALNSSPHIVEQSINELENWSLLVERGNRYGVHFLLEEYVMDIINQRPDQWRSIRDFIEAKELIF